MTENQAIATEILKQLQPQGSVSMLQAMTGAKMFVAIEKGVQFRYKGCPKHNTVVIKLNDSDLYDIEFWKINSKGAVKVNDEHINIYCDMLTSIFESETGLYLSL